jgi:hypothetical protein
MKATTATYRQDPTTARWNAAQRIALGRIFIGHSIPGDDGRASAAA